MKSTIETIMIGDPRIAKKNQEKPQNDQLLAEIIDCDEQMTELLSNETGKSELFEKFKKRLNKYCTEEAVLYYKAGFRSGFELAIDLLDKE